MNLAPDRAMVSDFAQTLADLAGGRGLLRFEAITPDRKFEAVDVPAKSHRSAVEWVIERASQRRVNLYCYAGLIRPSAAKCLRPFHFTGLFGFATDPSPASLAMASAFGTCEAIITAAKPVALHRFCVRQDHTAMTALLENLARQGAGGFVSLKIPVCGTWSWPADGGQPVLVEVEDAETVSTSELPVAARSRNAAAVAERPM
jgi:hypothetical protein